MKDTQYFRIEIPVHVGQHKTWYIMARMPLLLWMISYLGTYATHIKKIIPKHVRANDNKAQLILWTPQCIDVCAVDSVSALKVRVFVIICSTNRRCINNRELSCTLILIMIMVWHQRKNSLGRDNICLKFVMLIGHHSIWMRH